jgi:RNA polymerase sigma factor (sigma-70 family)
MIPFEEAIHVAPTDQPLSESSHEAQKRLNEALTRLPVEFREILVLREIEGWSYKQLASALNVPAAKYFRPESQETVCAGRRRSIRRRTAKNELALAAEQGLILSDATLAVNRRV